MDDRDSPLSQPSKYLTLFNNASLYPVIKVADVVPSVDERVIVIFSSPSSKGKEKDGDEW